MGDPKAAWEALDEILGRVPAGQPELRREIAALLDDVVAAMTDRP